KKTGLVSRPSLSYTPCDRILNIIAALIRLYAYAGRVGLQDNTTAGSPTTSAHELLETRCCCFRLGGSFNPFDACCRTRFGRQAPLPGIYACSHHLGMVRRVIFWGRGNDSELSDSRLPFRTSRIPFPAPPH